MSFDKQTFTTLYIDAIQLLCAIFKMLIEFIDCIHPTKTEIQKFEKNVRNIKI